jgi:lipid-A-disaccharide synthase
VLEALPYVIPTLLLQRRAKRELTEHPPDLVILIDYIGANLGMANFFRKTQPQMPIVYYIAPQEWVWSINDKNTTQIVNLTDRILAIFPAEARYYEQQGAKVTWVGHPLVDRMNQVPDRDTARQILGIPLDQTAILLSPASRQQELKYLLPIVFQAAQRIQAQSPSAQFYIPLALERYQSAIEQAIQDYGLQATIIPKEQGHLAIAAADLAITKSGTINLELALLNVPQVVVYRLSPSTAWLARHVLKFKIPFASPVNLVLMRAVVPELLQEAATVEAVTEKAIALLPTSGAAGADHSTRQQMLQDYGEVQQGLGSVGVCDRVAREIFALLPA